MDGLLILQSALYAFLGFSLISQLLAGFAVIRQKKAEGQKPLITPFLTSLLFTAVVGFLAAYGLVQLPFEVLGLPLNPWTVIIVNLLYGALLQPLAYLVTWAVYAAGTIPARKKLQKELEEKFKDELNGKSS
ncbi:hypothetical protein Bp8pC_053 [Bacillus phage Bp8p-C]|uniref:Uncharacterized protein n=2 Tax=Agatevirus Bp8pC TaxID=1910937 RepID=A0A0A0PQI7_9CAUD|nr:hypothetical protein AXJ20_gp053 [Bacillus phage Bp8p-C]YP_009784354.1 hypothetical protein QLX39_gp053 [Bacillus phage Bp8p-T]AHJ87484.1 hypothetical protein Bp8pC_053 [Bacillus phage Bp8p-C]AHJ87695.1 hypothetical protein Bp8pT_053 [Bacillus phage Bp8p-T]